MIKTSAGLLAFLSSFNCVLPSLPLDWSVGVGTEEGTVSMAPLLFEVGADMSNVQWAPRFEFARFKWFLVILVSRPALNKKGIWSKISALYPLPSRSTKFSSAVDYIPPLEKPWRRP